MTDTMGRVLTFNYDTSNRLVSVSAPNFTSGTRTVVQLHYKQITLSAGWASGISSDTATNTPWVIDSIYYPSTATGYWFNDSDSYSSYGMIAKVKEMRGMTSSGTTTTQGTVTAGTMSKQAVYSYTLTPVYTLTDAPTFANLTESWDGMDTAAPVTTYSTYLNSNPRTVEVTQPNGTRSKQFMNYAPGQWNDGLIYQDETYDSSNVLLAKSNVTWAQGGYETARPTRMEVRDERNQMTATEMTYDTTNPYNQVTSRREYDYDTTLIRDTRTTYENNAAYTGRHVFNLVKSVEVFDSSNVRLAKTDYEYDNNAVAIGASNHNLKATSGVVMHQSSSDPYTTETIEGCNEWQFNYPECSYVGEEIYVNDDEVFPGYGYYAICTGDYCLDPFSYSVYDENSIFRGNATKVTSYSNAAPGTPTGAISQTRKFDITGNLVEETASCCQLKTYDYTIATQYAYPTSASRGAASSSSSIRNTSASTYDFNTGLVKTSTNPNGRINTITYDTNSLRPVQSTASTGAYTTIAYNEGAMTITNETRESTGVIASKSIQYLNGIGKVKKEEALGASSVWDIVETTYTNLGQVWKQTRPYRSGQTIYWTENVYDALGRTKQVNEPDGSISKAFYNEVTRPGGASSTPGNTIRTVDSWGRERWGRTDAQEKLVEVVEPNPAGNGTVTASGLITTYSYDKLGQLIQTNQGAQQRSFKYDSLGRLVRQRMAEQTGTISDAGAYTGSGPWSDAFTYDNRSNLVQKVDARGVKTNYNYQVSGVDDPLNRIQSISYDLSGTRDTSKPVAAAATVSYEYMTTYDQDRIKKITTTGISTEEYTYDSEARVSEYTKTLLDRSSYPMKTSYLYDTLDRVKEINYPKQYGMSGEPRKQVIPTYDIASRLATLTVNGQTQASNIVYNAESQTTSINVGPTGTNQVTEEYTFDPQTGLMTNQKAIRNSTALMNLDYDYARNNSTGTLSGKTGALTKITNLLDSNKNREYIYDSIGRLITAKGGPTSNLWYQQYSYDRYGNRTGVAADGVAANSSAIPVDGIPSLSFDQATNRINSSGWEYDVAGNQTKALAEDGTSWLRFEYDAANRMVAVRKDSNGDLIQTQKFGVGNDRIYQKNEVTNQRTYYEGSIEYTESNNNGVLAWSKAYVNLGDAQLSTFTNNGSGGETVEYNHPDRLGTRLITNPSTGGSYEQVGLPFGTALAAETTGSTSKRFTSYERSSQTGLDYAQNRTYDSKQGRFTQVDPIKMGASSLGDPQSLNMYSYVGNDPVNRVDPSGLFWGGFFKKLWNFVVKVAKAVLAAAVVAAVVFFSGGTGAAVLQAFASTFWGALGFSFSKNYLTPGFNPNASHPLAVAGGGLNSKYVIKNFRLTSSLVAISLDKLAIAWLRLWNPISIKLNTEFAVSFCKLLKTGEIFETHTVGGNRDGSTPPDCPSFSVTVATAHTHGRYDKTYDSENFSPDDRENANIRSFRAGHTVYEYLATPRGKLKKFIPAQIKDWYRPGDSKAKNLERLRRGKVVSLP